MFVIIIPVQQAYISCVFGAIPQTGQSVKFSGSGFLFGGWCWFSWFRRFHLFLGRPLFSFLLQQSLFVFHIPLVFQLFRLLGIFVGHSQTQLTSVLMDRLYLRFHRPITNLGPGLEAMEGVCTHGGDPPQSSSSRSNPLT